MYEGRITGFRPPDGAGRGTRPADGRRDRTPTQDRAAPRRTGLGVAGAETGLIDLRPAAASATPDSHGPTAVQCPPAAPLSGARRCSARRAEQDGGPADAGGRARLASQDRPPGPAAAEPAADQAEPRPRLAGGQVRPCRARRRSSRATPRSSRAGHRRGPGLGGLLIAFTDPAVLHAWGSFLRRPGQRDRRRRGTPPPAPTRPCSRARSSTRTRRGRLPQASLLALHDGAVSAVFNPLSETAVNATPLILAGLSVALAFRAGLFNIGAAEPVDRRRHRRHLPRLRRSACRRSST